MKLSRLFSVMILILVTALLLTFSASAADTDIGLHFIANEESANTVIYPQTARDKGSYLFLPSSADLKNITLLADEQFTTLTFTADSSVTVSNGESVDLTALFNDFSACNGEYKLKITASTADNGEESAVITVMKSENLKSLFIVSEDPENKGRKWVDTSKSNKTKGEFVYLNADGTVCNADAITEIKGRGNSTFTDFTKKPYQIKIKNKFNMTGDEDNAQKKWVLLANAGDITLIHNQLVVDLAKGLGLPYTIDCESIDLYYDGEYRGTYLITDKAEVGDEGIQIQDLDGIIEELNEGSDAYEDPVVVTKTFADGGKTDAKTDSKGSYKYVDGLKEPELEEGTTHHAYLLELDFIYRYADEQSGFVTNRGQAVVTKNPEYLTKETGAFISNFYQEFEDAVFSPDGYNTKTGKYYYDYCDLDSLVKIYLINEFTKNYDSYRSSTYFYLPEDEDIMYAGPIWDYDLCFTTGYDYNSQIAGNPENFWAATKYLASTLITIESFRDAVKEYLNSEDGVFYLEAAKMLGEDGNIMKLSQMIYASQRMNYKLWDITHEETAAFRCGDEETYDNGIDFLLDFATERLEWLSETTSEWNGNSYKAPKDPTKWSSTTRYHDNIVTVPAVLPTCTESGKTESTVCKDCNKVFSGGKKLEPMGHDWLTPTCTEPRTCKDCGITESEPAGHDWAEATCQTPKTCTVCGEINEDASLLPHDWLDATCDRPETCSMCGLTRGNPDSHDYKLAPDDERYSETCIVYKCTKCKASLLIPVAPKPTYKTGDINKDGRITAADARLALRFASKLDTATQEQSTLADINKDNRLTAADARLILRKAAGLDK